jgi:hypothetical protein
MKTNRLKQTGRGRVAPAAKALFTEGSRYHIRVVPMRNKNIEIIDVDELIIDYDDLEYLGE